MLAETYTAQQVQITPAVGGGGGGVLPYISYIGMCRLKGYGF